MSPPVSRTSSCDSSRERVRPILAVHRRTQMLQGKFVHPLTKFVWHDISLFSGGMSAKIATNRLHVIWVRGADKMIKVHKVMITPIMVENQLFWSFRHHRRLTDDSLNWFGCVIGGSAILGKVRSKGQRSRWRPNRMWWKKAEAYHPRLATRWFLVDNSKPLQHVYVHTSDWWYADHIVKFSVVYRTCECS